jgi:hypothetical protein
MKQCQNMVPNHGIINRSFASKPARLSSITESMQRKELSNSVTLPDAMCATIASASTLPLDRVEQSEMATILFFYHFNQMAANMMVMRDDIREREEKAEFNILNKTVVRLWKRIEKRYEMHGFKESYENLSSELGDVLYIFLTSNDYEGLMEVMKKYNESVGIKKVKQ